MSDITIYHNPRCSKSRQTLQLLEQKGIQPRVVHYLETPPSPRELRELADKLGISPRALLRTREDDYRQCGLDNAALGDDAVLKAMSEHPKLIERPIVVRGDRAVLGRPPENVLELL